VIEVSWLTGWNHRKSHTINGATGAGENYQVKTKVLYGYVPASSLSFVSRIDDVFSAGTDPHMQGVVSDGTYLYASLSNHLKKTPLSSIDFDNPVAENTHPQTDGTDMNQVNHIYIRGDYIYAGSSNYPDTPKEGYIKVYKKSDLTYVEEHQVLDYHSEGCSFYDNAWWIVYYDYAYVSKYDTNWNHVADYALTDTHSQGCIWIGDLFYVSSTRGTDYLDIYSWSGSAFTLIASLGVTNVASNQGIGKEPGEDILWVAEAYAVDDKNNIVKETINYELVGCSNRCKTDFGDIRFTDNDGLTELDYWMETKVDSNYAIFWVEVKDDLGSERQIYMYYGKGDATTTSNGSNTFPDFYDDFPDLGDPTDDVWSKSGTGSVDVLTDGDALHEKMCKIIGGGEAPVDECLYSKDTYGYPFRVHFRTKDSHSGDALFFRGGALNNPTAFTNGFQAYNHNDEDILTRKDGSSTYTDLGTFDMTIYHIYDLSWCTGHVYVDIDFGSKTYDITSNIPTVDMVLSFHTYKDSASYIKYLDYVFVAKYVDPEPNHGIWGSEETPPPVRVPRPTAAVGNPYMF